MLSCYAAQASWVMLVQFHKIKTDKQAIGMVKKGTEGSDAQKLTRCNYWELFLLLLTNGCGC